MDNKYYFVLLSNSSGERFVCPEAPRGWDATKANIIRDVIYLGILKSVSVELGFVGAAFTFMQQHRLRYGMDADIILRIYLTKRNEFIFEGKIDFAKFAEQRKFGIFKVDVLQSSFVQKFNNREDIELNVLNTMSMDREVISPPILEDAIIRGKQIRFYSEFNDVIVPDPPAPEIYHHLPPFKLGVNGNPGVKEVSNLIIDEWAADNVDSSLADMQADRSNPLKSPDNAFYVNVLTQSQEIELTWQLSFTAVYAGTANAGNTFGHQNYLIHRLWKVDADGTVLEQLFYNIIPLTSGTVSETLSYSGTLTMEPGQYLIDFYEKWGKILNILDNEPQDTSDMDTTLRTEVTYSSMLKTIEQPSIIDDTTHKVMLPWELFSSLVSQIGAGVLHSKIFARTDVINPITGEFYEEEGDGALLATTLGTWLRGIPVDETQYKTSLRKAFKSYSTVFCLGAQITKNRIQIDTLDELFSAEVNTDLGEVDDLQIEPTDEFLFNSVKTGYPSNEYEQENGRDEFNTPYQFSNSFQSVKKDLDTMSFFCGDGYGIEFARRQSVVTTGTQDSRYDDKIFFIDLVRDEELGLISRRQEDILLVSGIFSPETVINARIAVIQNVLRWKKYYNIPLHRKPDKVLYFQSKDKNAGLRVVTILGDTSDGQDIQLGSAAYFLNEGKRFKRPISLFTLAELMALPLGRTRFTSQGETFYDYLMEVNSEIEKHATQWRMLGTRATPPDVADVPYGNYVKYGDGLEDFIKYNDGNEDVIKYAD